MAALNSGMGKPFYHVYSQAIMAAYFILMVPLVSRIPLGLYESGVWGDAGFVPYEKIARMAFLETPEISLVLVPRGGRAARCACACRPASTAPCARSSKRRAAPTS